MHKVRNFHEGHSTVGEWQGSGRVVAGSWQGRGRETAWERHGNGMGTAWYVRIGTKATNTHSECVIVLFHCHSGCKNAPQCYVTRTSPVLFELSQLLLQISFVFGTECELAPSWTAMKGCCCCCSSSSYKTAIVFVSGYAKQVVVGVALTHHTSESVRVAELNNTEFVSCGVSCRVRTLIRPLSTPFSLHTHTAWSSIIILPKLTKIIFVSQSRNQLNTLSLSQSLYCVLIPYMFRASSFHLQEALH
jgi:hypothetical protein